MKKTSKASSSAVLTNTRNAVIIAAERMQQLAKETKKLVGAAEKKWEDSKPAQKKAKTELKKIAAQAARIGRDVQEGLKEGFAEVQKRNKKK